MNPSDQYSKLLIEGAKSGCVDSIRRALATGLSVDARYQASQPAIWHAASKGHTEATLALVESDAIAHVLHGSHGNPLHGALQQVQFRTASLLLDKGLSPLLLDTQGESPAHALLHLYERYSLNPAEEPVAHKLLARLLDAGIRANQCCGQGHSLLRFAIDANAPYEILALLADRGARLTQRGPGGLEPIHAAARADNATAVTFLAEHGVDINDQDAKGMTPLHHMVGVAAGQVLIAGGARIDLQDDAGRTALAHHLIEMKKTTSIASIALLIAAGADLDLEDREGVTPRQTMHRRRLKEVLTAVSAHAARNAMRQVAPQQSPKGGV
jgi:hypothetical protein